jgi:magnesium-transporting ATPase (P-type)
MSETEKADKEKADKEKADKEKADKEKADKEKADKEKENLANKSAVWGICFYLVVAFVFFGFLCFFAWQKSDVFTWVGINWDATNAETFRRIIFALCGGAIGGVSYSLWQLFEHFCRAKDFESVWTIWYIFGPVNGAILGLATYAVILGGLLVLGSDMDLRSSWALFALAFVAGFGSKRVLRKLHAINGEIFQKESAAPSKTTADKQPAGKKTVKTPKSAGTTNGN